MNSGNYCIPVNNFTVADYVDNVNPPRGFPPRFLVKPPNTNLPQNCAIAGFFSQILRSYFALF